LVFGGSSSGCSRFEPKPTWQTDPGCANRTIADVAAVASEFTPVSIYDSYQLPGWFISAGTSVAAPLIAGVYALAGNAGQLDGAGYAYAHPGALNDVTQGRTGTCVPTYLCTAGPGYDGPTGLGTPQGVGGF
jgi:hypothetical protein